MIEDANPEEWQPGTAPVVAPAEDKTKSEDALIEQAVEAAMIGFCTLLHALVTTKRFHEVKRLATVGLSLQTTRKQTAEDYLRAEQDGQILDNNGFNIGNNMIRAAPMIGMGAWGAGNDGQNLQRELMLTLEKHVANQHKDEKGREAKNDADELDSLTQSVLRLPLDSPHRAALDARITHLVTRITERNTNDEKPSEPALVPAELPRGHQIGANGA